MTRGGGYRGGGPAERSGERMGERCGGKKRKRGGQWRGKQRLVWVGEEGKSRRDGAYFANQIQRVLDGVFEEVVLEAGLNEVFGVVGLRREEARQFLLFRASFQPYPARPLPLSPSPNR